MNHSFDREVCIFEMMNYIKAFIHSVTGPTEGTTTEEVCDNKLPCSLLHV
jgi:hypothetical protein